MATPSPSVLSRMRVAQTTCLALVASMFAGCSQRPNAPLPSSVAGAIRSGLAAAGTVADTEGAASRTARFVPLAGRADADVELLSGHPDSADKPFVMRIREHAGTVIPAHRHPVDEHLTVLRGSIRFGTGERFDSTALRTLGPGSYAFLPAGTTMFAIVDDEAVVQVHGTGPFHIHWLDGLSVLDATVPQPPFRFRLGDPVVGKRGAGRIREGYASGALVQYVVQRADSTRYMAQQADLSPP